MILKTLHQSISRLVHWILYIPTGFILDNSNRTRTVIIADGKILLQRSYFGHQKWSLPGGGIKRSEAPEKANVRELAEETGLKILMSRFVELGVRKVEIRESTWPLANVYFFACFLDKIEEPKILRNAEIIDVKWVDIENLPRRHSKTVDIGLELVKLQSSNS